MSKLSLSIAILFSTFFSPYLFATSPLVNCDDQKEGFSEPTEPLVATPKQITVCDYTFLNNKNVNHILDDIEEVEDDLGDYVSAVNAKLVTTNNQTMPLILGAVLQHKQNHEYHQYLITDTGLLSETTQFNAVKRAHRKGFHLIQATRGHVSLQLLEWLQISKHYTVIALHTNKPVCSNCYLIAHSLWKKKLKSNEKGCIGVTFPLLDKMPNLAKQYINAHLNLSLVQSLVVPIMGYVSKEEMNKSIQKNKEMDSFIASMQELNNKQIAILSKQVKTKNIQLNEQNKQIQIITNKLNNKDERIETLSNQLKDKDTKLNEKNKQLTTLKSSLKEKGVNHQQELNKKDDQLEENDEKINMLDQEISKKDKRIADFQSILENIPKQRLDYNAKKELFKAIKNNNVNKVELFLEMYKDVVNARDDEYRTPFLCAAQSGHFKILKLLKAKGADVNATDKYGYDALDRGYRKGLVVGVGAVAVTGAIASPIINNNGLIGPDIFGNNASHLPWAHGVGLLGAADMFGNNALHEACKRSGNLEMVTWLIDVCDLPLETKGKDGRTPFLFAAYWGNLNVLKVLKAKGADVKAKDNDGKTALDLAKKRKHDKVIHYLKSVGCR